VTVAPDRPPPAGRSPLGRVLRAAGILAAVAFVALLAYGLTTKSADRTIDDALSRGEAVAPPGFELARLADGSPSGPSAATWRRASADGEVALDELSGTPVVLNFWASWCEPCRAEAKVLQQGWEDSRGEVLFLGLDAQDASEDARDFIAQFGLTFPHVRDPSNATSRDWGVTGLPETYFLAADGRVVGHVIGSVSEQQLREGVAAARAGRPRDAAQGGEQRPTRDG
jgi:cytochrome c biogenesis protein CcmG, thiol:disulfide interchange protein DsbE